MTVRRLWPDKNEDGSVSVAVRFEASGIDPYALLGDEIRSWSERLRTERKVDLTTSLSKSPYVMRSGEATVDVVFEGRAGSRRWRDWLVSFTRHMEDVHPEMRRVGFWDLVGQRPNPASLHGE